MLRLITTSPNVALLFHRFLFALQKFKHENIPQISVIFTLVTALWHLRLELVLINFFSILPGEFHHLFNLF